MTKEGSPKNFVSQTPIETLGRDSRVAIQQAKICQSLEHKYGGDFQAWNEALSKYKAIIELELDAVKGLISQTERLLTLRGHRATKRRQGFKVPNSGCCVFGIEWSKCS